MRGLAFLLLLVGPLMAQQAHPKTPEGPEISGVVVNAASGQPLARTKITIAAVEGRNELSSVITRSDGEFLFEHLKPGKYSLTAQRAGFPTQSFDQHENYSSAIAVGVGLKSTGLVFRLRPEAVVSGTVRDESDEPVRDADVLLFHRGTEGGRVSTHLAAQSRTDDQGNYRFGKLFDGDLLVAVRTRPWYAQSSQIWNNGEPASSDLDVAYPITFYPGVTDPEAASTISVHSGDQVTADFVLRAVPAAHLHVLQSDPNRQQITAHLTQPLFDNYDDYVQTQNFWQSQGFVLAGFAPGTYVVHVNAPHTEERTEEVTIDGEATVDPENMTGTVAAKVSGTVVVRGYSGGFSDAILQISDAAHHHRAATRIGPDGKFEMPQVKAGTYEVYLVNMPGVYVQGIEGPGSAGRLVKITDKDASLVVYATKGAGTVTGTVIQGETPVAGAMVMLVPEGRSGNLTLYRRDQSDSDGTFTLREIVPGQYTVVAIMEGWGIQWANPEVLKPYLANGQTVRVIAGGKYDVKVGLQAK